MNKNINLSIGVIALLIFIGYLGTSEDMVSFGLNINIWVFRLIWLFIAVVQLLTFFRKSKMEK